MEFWAYKGFCYNKGKFVIFLLCKTIGLKEKDWNFGRIKASVAIMINLQDFVFSVFNKTGSVLITQH
jgi:hypothetical protein